MGGETKMARDLWKHIPKLATRRTHAASLRGIYANAMVELCILIRLMKNAAICSLQSGRKSKCGKLFYPLVLLRGFYQWSSVPVRWACKSRLKSAAGGGPKVQHPLENQSVEEGKGQEG
jgi:hypothetical protein